MIGSRGVLRVWGLETPVNKGICSDGRVYLRNSCFIPAANGQKFCFENAAWWWMMILALNLNQMLKCLALEPQMGVKRMKAIRFSIINIPGRILKRSRELVLRLSKGHPCFNVLVGARERIALLEGLPSG
jgi:hypothetical protein